MSSNFLPAADLAEIKRVYDAGDKEQLYDLLVQPLHEELYKRQSFEFMDDLSWGQQLLLANDYLHMQVGQGGFIQFIENGYIGLLPSMIEQLIQLGAPDMAQVLDDVLKVYVLNAEQLGKKATVEEFAKLYDEFKEFEEIEERYRRFNPDTTKQMLEYAMNNLHEFVRAQS